MALQSRDPHAREKALEKAMTISCGIAEGEGEGEGDYDDDVTEARSLGEEGDDWSDANSSDDDGGGGGDDDDDDDGDEELPGPIIHQHCTADRPTTLPQRRPTSDRPADAEQERRSGDSEGDEEEDDDDGDDDDDEEEQGEEAAAAAKSQCYGLDLQRYNHGPIHSTVKRPREEDTRDKVEHSQGTPKRRKIERARQHLDQKQPSSNHDQAQVQLQIQKRTKSTSANENEDWPQLNSSARFAGMTPAVQSASLKDWMRATDKYMSAIDAGAMPAKKVRRFFRRVKAHFGAVEQAIDDLGFACRTLLHHSDRVQEELAFADCEAGVVLGLLATRFAVPAGIGVGGCVGVEGDMR